MSRRSIKLLRRAAAFDMELTISPGFLTSLLILLGIAILVACERIADPDQLLQLQVAGTGMIVVSLAAWRISGGHPLAGRWLLVAMLLLVVVAGDAWMGVPGMLAFVFLPGLAATMLINRPAGLSASIASSLAAWALCRWVPGGAGRPPIELVVASVAVTQAILFAIHRHMQQLSTWVYAQYQIGRTMQREAQQQKLELSRALGDLAQANEQLQRLNKVAQGMRETAEEALAAKARFVANVSHELRTPLNMITGFSEMITQMPETYGKLPPALLADLTVIRRNSEHLSSLIDDVLDLSQIEQGEMALSKERTDLVEIVQAAIVAVRPLYAAKGLYLKSEIAEDLPPVFCDRTRIREVVLNLLSNAGRFTEKGGVLVRARLRDGAIECSVSDTGPGIAPGDLGRIFEPFHQADESIRRRYGGSGLGLSISKQFITLHDGEIWVESAIGQGTTFHFRLPVAQMSAPDVGHWWRWATPGWEYLQRTEPTAAPLVKPRARFVVVEKGGGLARLLARYLDNAQIVLYSELQSALADVTHTAAEALLVNDMAVGDALQQLRAADLPHGLPAIVCSVPGPQETATNLGVSDYLVKPISRDKLLATLEGLHLAGNTVLIVDDQPEALRLFRRMLGSSPRAYRVLRARDGLEGLQMLREQHPDAILLDLVMPHMDGFRLLEERSRDPELARIPVIVISARDPMGQPIVSGVLAVTLGGGLSTHHLLTGITTLARLFSPLDHNGGPTPAEELHV
jgi:signal transduction histidine kinase/CheY-like chemotaxis protein